MAANVLQPRFCPTHWKLNNTFLSHESFLPQFTSLFRQLEEEIENCVDIADWWDEFAKPASISFCKSFSSSVARQRKTYKKFLQSLL